MIEWRKTPSSLYSLHPLLLTDVSNCHLSPSFPSCTPSRNIDTFPPPFFDLHEISPSISFIASPSWCIYLIIPLKLDRLVDVIVASPGRLMQHKEQGNLFLSQVRSGHLSLTIAICRTTFILRLQLLLISIYCNVLIWYVLIYIELNWFDLIWFDLKISICTWYGNKHYQ